MVTVGDLQLLSHHGYCGRLAVIESPWILWDLQLLSRHGTVATCSY